MITWLAFIFAKGPHFVFSFMATSSLEICIRNQRRRSAHQLTKGLWEGPQPILHACQIAVVSCEGQMVTLVVAEGYEKPGESKAFTPPTEALVSFRIFFKKKLYPVFLSSRASKQLTALFSPLLFYPGNIRPMR